MSGYFWPAVMGGLVGWTFLCFAMSQADQQKLDKAAAFYASEVCKESTGSRSDCLLLAAAKFKAGVKP